MNGIDNARLKIVFEDLQAVIADFAVKHEITSREFQLTIETITQLVKSGELPVAALTFFSFSVAVADEGRYYLNPEKGGASAWLPVGPAYVEGAPVLERPYVLPMRPDEPGEPLIVSGQVCSTSGVPIADAEIDLWMTNHAGDYSGLTSDRLAPLVIALDDSLPKYNLRGKIHTDKDGRYRYRTVMPGLENLGIPQGGPLDHLYRALARVEVRPLHIHAIVTAESFHTLTTQSHFRGDPAIGKTSEPLSTPNSTVFDHVYHNDHAEVRECGLSVPFHTMNINYILRKSAE